MLLSPVPVSMMHTAASLNTQVLNYKIAGAIGIYTVKPVMRGHLNKCPYMTCVPSSQVHFNVKVHFWFTENAI